MSELPERLAPYASRLGSFPAGAIPLSPLRRLVAPMIERAMMATTIDEWKPGAMTSTALAVALEDVISAAHWRTLPQYDVFRLIPTSARIVSFNWDGLAGARCPQGIVYQPHGIVFPRVMVPDELDALLNSAQEDDAYDPRDWILTDLVMPGEEDGPKLTDVRQAVHHLWRKAPMVVIIGYSFGIGSETDYDRVWLDTFVEAFRVNTSSPIHLVNPNAEWLRGELVERLGRSVNVHAWPLKWRELSHAITSFAADNEISDLSHVRMSQADFTKYFVGRSA